MYLNAAAILIVVVFSHLSSEEITHYGECNAPDAESGLCIPLTQCAGIMQLLQRFPLSGEEISFAQQSQCGYSNGRVLVCCPMRHRTIKSPYASPSLASVKSTESTESQSKSEVISYGPCETPSKRPAMCIGLSDCPAMLSLIRKQPLSPEEKSFVKKSQCGYINSTILVCCPEPTSTLVRIETELGQVLPKQGTCGNVFTDRVSNGNTTQIDEYPWMALIEYEREGRPPKYNCGGSLINHRYVLTAAHCASMGQSGWKPVRVRLGEWDTNTDVDCQTDSRGYRDCADPHKDIRIERVISHELYDANSTDQYDDIALLRLAEKVSYTEFIQPICLPITLNLRTVNFEKQYMDIVGWGLTEYGIRSNIKMKASIPVVSLSDCQKVIDSRRVGNSQICAGGENGVDACKGDSGGPLIGIDTADKMNPFLYVAGIISYGTSSSRGCGAYNSPGIYTKVGEYVDWIIRNLEP